MESITVMNHAVNVRLGQRKENWLVMNGSYFVLNLLPTSIYDWRTIFHHVCLNTYLA